jgi:hypothetical protein
MAECAGKVKNVPLDDEMVRTARGLGISFGDEDLTEMLPEALTDLEAISTDLTADDDPTED